MSQTGSDQECYDCGENLGSEAWNLRDPICYTCFSRRLIRLGPLWCVICDTIFLGTERQVTRCTTCCTIAGPSMTPSEDVADW